MIDLSTWKLTLPTANEVYAKDLLTYTDMYFKLEENRLKLRCPVSGKTTPNAKYSRCELRETINPLDDNELWPINLETHTLDVSMYVTAMPSNKKMIVAQLMAQKPLLKVQLEKNNLYLIFKHAKGHNTKYLLLKSAKYYTELNIHIEVDFQGVYVKVNNESRMELWEDLGTGWTDQLFYFRTGCYPQDNEGDEIAGVNITRLTTTHTISDQEKIDYIYNAIKRIEKILEQCLKE